RLQRERAREQQRHLRLVASSSRERERQARADYVRDREQEVSELNGQMVERIAELSSILAQTLQIDDRIEFELLRIRDEFLPFQPPATLADAQPAPIRERYFTGVQAPKGLASLWPGASRRHAERLKECTAALDSATAEWKENEWLRLEKLHAL